LAAASVPIADRLCTDYFPWGKPVYIRAGALLAKMTLVHVFVL